jgi:hypothetical protein
MSPFKLRLAEIAWQVTRRERIAISPIFPRKAGDGIAGPPHVPPPEKPTASRCGQPLANPPNIRFPRTPSTPTIENVHATNV